MDCHTKEQLFKFMRFQLGREMLRYFWLLDTNHILKSYSLNKNQNLCHILYCEQLSMLDSTIVDRRITSSHIRIQEIL